MAFTHSSPLVTTSVWMPNSLSISTAISLFITLSSAKSILLPSKETRGSFSSFLTDSLSSKRSKVIVTVTVVPFPCSLSISIFPPIASTSLLVIVIPKPVPDIPLRVALRSLEKELNTKGRNSFDIPIPLSLTTNSKTERLLSSFLSSWTLNVTLPPLGVYFTALLKILSSIFCTFTLSHRIVVWQALPDASNESPFSFALSFTETITSLIKSWHRQGLRERSIFPLSILAISKTSPIKPTSCLPQIWILSI